MDMKIKSEFIARRLSDRQHVIRIKNLPNCQIVVASELFSIFFFSILIALASQLHLAINERIEQSAQFACKPLK